MIAVIDYGMGNLKSVSKAFEKVGAEVCVTRDKKKIQNADKLVLPGVGAFGRCIENLNQFGLVEIIKSEIDKGKWFLGICLGLQLLFDESEEFGPVSGLKILPGKVRRFTLEDPFKIPHMGWNQIKKNNNPTLFKGIDENTSFYFVHSFYVDPLESNIIATTTDYGGSFCSSVEKNNILACQFHPEKSQKSGLKVLENFKNL